ncbi:MAG: hypothetical protein E7K92_02405 [Serratia marcescens]|nr:type II toxin-antitoxin system RelB/DinJ family antitoxin [Serratia marcescens]EJC6395450.1 type II toxin-antitoxin system RelB/DinJ family antitoxin [Serratia marcescens]MDU7466747.1 hypothetical protein [Serratia marcescens]HEJ7007236.1 type II toxin-antitoxin system RelB/DinJ family antitoxin [Serratia marcescens]
MSEQIQIGVKVNKDLKNEVDDILRGLGIKPTTAITGLYNYILQHRELPFVINIQVNKPSTLVSNLFMDFTLLKKSLGEFYVKIEAQKHVFENELMLLKNVIREFSTNFRQIEKALYQFSNEYPVDWKKVFNGAKRAFYVLEAYLKFDPFLGYHLEDEGVIKLSMALKMIQDAEKNA